MNCVRGGLIALCLLSGPVAALSAQQPSTGHWVGSWACSQQAPEPNNALPDQALHGALLRQIVHLSLGGDRVRVHISNAFGSTPLHIAAVYIAIPSSASGSAIDVVSDRALTFNAATDVIIPARSEYISDPATLHIAPLSNLAITIQFDNAPTGQTSHPGSRQTSYVSVLSTPGARDLPDAKPIDHWFQISGVDVEAAPRSSALVALGDSITDGHGATTNGNDRWPDLLAARLQNSPATRDIGVLNQGIGGNRLLLDGLGPNALARFDRDVLAQPGVKYVIVLEGVNDLGTATREAEISQAEHDSLVTRIEGAYMQVVERGHARGLRVFGATITPYLGSGYYHPGPMSEADRQKINQWIRAAGHFDGFVDFDNALADPANPQHLLPAFDSGDHLHPSPAGYKAMANSVPLTLFSSTP